MPRAVLDENVSLQVGERLRTFGYEVLPIAKQPSRGMSDEAVFALATEGAGLLVTRDTHFTPPQEEAVGRGSPTPFDFLPERPAAFSISPTTTSEDRTKPNWSRSSSHPIPLRSSRDGWFYSPQSACGFGRTEKARRTFQGRETTETERKRTSACARLIR